MDLIRVVRRFLQPIHEVILDARNGRDTGAVQVIGAVSVQLQHLSNTEVIHEPNTKPVEGVPKQLCVHGWAAKGLGVKVRVHDGRVRLRGAVKAILRRLTRLEIGQRVVWWRQLTPVELTRWHNALRRGWRNIGSGRLRRTRTAPQHCQKCHE